MTDDDMDFCDEPAASRGMSLAEQRLRRRLAYQKAKQEREADPEYQRLRAQHKEALRAQYLQAKAQHQAAAKAERQQQKQTKEAERAAQRAAKMQALAALLRPASELAAEAACSPQRQETKEGSCKRAPSKPSKP